jgi:chromosome segregation ATPase
MKNGTLIERSEVEKYYVSRATTSLIDDAIEEIERLEEAIGQNNSKYVQMAGKLKETNDNYNVVVERNNELEAESKDRKEIIKKYEEAYGALILKNNSLQAELRNLALAAHSDKDEVVKTQDLQREAVDMLKDEAERAQAHSNAEAERHEEHRRDMFACAAMEGILARMQSTGLEDFVAERAYELADAMLKARERK